MIHTDPSTPDPGQSPDHPGLGEAFRVWARIGLLSFGGPAGQIALMHRVLVEEKRWLDERRFLHALNFCMLLPGPEALQLVIYIGWLMHRVTGGVIAGLLFILPGVVSIMALSWVYALWGDVGVVAALFFGLKAAVLAIVVQALFRIGARALRGGAMLAIAASAFVAIFAFDLPFPLIIAAAALLGLGAARAGLAGFAHAGGHGPGGNPGPDRRETVLGAQSPAHAFPGAGRAGRAGLAALILWLVPVMVLTLALGPAHVFSAIAIFFSQVAIVTFGGAYAVLAWVAQEVVITHGWLEPGEMLDGLGMAETTPGPLIMVVQFVGFMGALRDAGGLSPLMAATLGGLLASWVTFVPSFAWIFLGAPYMERLRDNRAISAALSAITAAVVGVIANLALWFAIHVLFAESARVEAGPLRLELPVPATLDPIAALLVVAALGAVLWLRAGVLTVLAGCAAAGMGLYLAGLI